MAAAWLGLAFHDQWDPDDKAWVNECLVIAKSEVRRAKRSLPQRIDRSDLQSCAHEVIAANYKQIRDGALMRLRIRSRLLDMIRRDAGPVRVCKCACGVCKNGECTDCVNPACQDQNCADHGCEHAYPYRTLIPGSPGRSETRCIPWEAISKTVSEAEYAILLKHYDGKTATEIAAELGVTQQAVSKRIAVSIKKFKGRL